MPAPLIVDVFADLVCPWCFIGFERLTRVVNDTKSPASFRLRHRAFLLDPSTPAEGTNVHDKLREKYGDDPAPLFARAEAAARESGIPLDLMKQPMSYSTVAAQTLLRQALPKGTQWELARALFRTYFLQAQNLSDPDVLVAVAMGYGFGAYEARQVVLDEKGLKLTREEAEDAARAGVRGVPLFVFGRSFVVSGAQSESILREALDRAREPKAEQRDSNLGISG